MRALYRRDLADDRGSIILALLGIIILTTVASVGLAAVVNGQHQSRHDNTFTQALNNAESGVDAMVAALKYGIAPTSGYNYTNPTQATGMTPTLSASDPGLMETRHWTCLAFPETVAEVKISSSEINLKP